MNQKKFIPSPSQKKHILNDAVALIDRDESEDKFRIAFDYYNDGLCEIDVLQTSSARKCLIKLRQMGKSTHKTLKENNVHFTPVHNTGRYKELFSKLSKDVSLFEIDIGSASRLFYFLVGNLVQIVSVKNSHIKY